jgi:hypothetical protein
MRRPIRMHHVYSVLAIGGASDKYTREGNEFSPSMIMESAEAD